MTPAMERLGKWRTVFAGRWLGSRSKADPECQSVRDIEERTLALRAEVNALTAILIQKGICTAIEFTDQLNDECDYLCSKLEEQFPGFKATDDGIAMDVKKAAETTKGWPP